VSVSKYKQTTVKCHNRFSGLWLLLIGMKELVLDTVRPRVERSGQCPWLYHRAACLERGADTSSRSSPTAESSFFLSSTPSPSVSLCELLVINQKYHVQLHWYLSGARFALKDNSVFWRLDNAWRNTHLHYAPFVQGAHFVPTRLFLSEIQIDENVAEHPKRTKGDPPSV
jgi:hypothetical protein